MQRGTSPAQQGLCRNAPRSLNKLSPRCYGKCRASDTNRWRMCSWIWNRSAGRFSRNPSLTFSDRPNSYSTRSALPKLATWHARLFSLTRRNQQARNLLEKANAELKRILNRPKVQQFVDKGHALLGEGKLQEAKVAAEHALQLDSSFIPAEELQRDIQKEIDRARIISEWLETAKQHLAEGLPNEAETLLAQVLEADPSNTQAQSFGNRC